jgi:hypothetical protein
MRLFNAAVAAPMLANAAQVRPAAAAPTLMTQLAGLGLATDHQTNSLLEDWATGIHGTMSCIQAQSVVGENGTHHFILSEGLFEAYHFADVREIWEPV